MFKKTGFFWHFFFNFDVFWSLCLLEAILAQKENSFIWKKMWFFDTPGTPWGASAVERNYFGSKQPLWKLENLKSYGYFRFRIFWGFFAHSNLPLGTLYRNLTTLSAFNIFVAWIKIFKYLSFNKTMIQLSGTLSAVITFNINIIFITYLPYFQKFFFSQQKIYLDFLWCFSSSTLLLFNLDSCCLVFK